MEKEFDIIYSTKWNKGEKSGMLPLERLEIHNLWLKKNHEDCRKVTINETSTPHGIDDKWDNDLQGFIKF